MRQRLALREIATRTPRVRFVPFVLGAAVAVELALVLVLRYFVTVDGAFHLGVAGLMHDALSGQSSLVFQYYKWHIRPVPNLLPDLVLTALMFVFSSATSEKLLIAGYIVGLPSALFYAVRAVAPENAWLALIALPLTFSFSFNYGFYNFSYSVILFLVVAGYTLRHRHELDRRRLAILAGLLVLTYLTHIIGFLEASLFVGSVAVVERITTRREQGSRRPSRRRVVTVAALIVPILLVAAWFLVSTRTAVPDHWELQPSVRLQFLALALGVTSYSRYESVWTAFLALALAALVVAVVRVRGRPLLRCRDADGPLLFVVVGSLAVAVAPFQVESGGSFILQRLSLFPVYGLVLWIAGHRLSRAPVFWAGAAALVAAVGLGIMRLPTYRKLDAIVTDFMSVAPCLAPRSTLVEASMALALPDPDVRLDPVTDETGRLAADLHGVDLGSINGSVPFYMLQFRPPVDPERGLVRPGGSIEGIPPPLDPLGYERRTGGRVDYVLLFGRSRADAKTLRSPVWAAFRRELSTGYDLVAVSPHRWVEAWERRTAPAARGDRARSRGAQQGVCRGVSRSRRGLH